MASTSEPPPKSEFNVSNLVVQHGLANTGSNEPLEQQAYTGIIKTREERIKHLKGVLENTTGRAEKVDLQKAVVRCEAQIAEATAELKRLKKS